jgi:hypothetical protein
MPELPRYGPTWTTEIVALTAHRSASPDEHHRLLWRFSDVLMTDGIPVINASCSSTAYKPRLRSAWTVCGLAMPSR